MHLIAENICFPKELQKATRNVSDEPTSLCKPGIQLILCIQ